LAIHNEPAFSRSSQLAAATGFASATALNDKLWAASALGYYCRHLGPNRLWSLQDGFGKVERMQYTVTKNPVPDIREMRYGPHFRHTIDFYNTKSDIAWEWNKRPEFVDYGPLPAIRSYAFKDAKTRGPIPVNLDTTAAHTVKLVRPAAVENKTAKTWRLAADSIAANNEYETGDPQVKIAEETSNNFSSGSEIKLPPHSMLVLKWQIAD
jgi:hypothetical protein